MPNSHCFIQCCFNKCTNYIMVIFLYTFLMQVVKYWRLETYFKHSQVVGYNITIDPLFWVLIEKAINSKSKRVFHGSVWALRKLYFLWIKMFQSRRNLRSSAPARSCFPHTSWLWVRDDGSCFISRERTMFERALHKTCRRSPKITRARHSFKIRL